MIEKKGKFIVVEGPGGCGKTTQINLIGNDLRSKNLDILITREPGGCESSERIREFIFSTRERNLFGPEGQLALFMAARLLWTEKVVIPAYNNGLIVLTDRWATSTRAYQGFAEGGDLDQIDDVTRAVICMTGIKPDAIFYLRVGYEELRRRQKSLKLNNDPYDKQPEAYWRRLIKGYDSMAKEGWLGIPWYTINGEQKVDLVQRDIKEVLQKII